MTWADAEKVAAILGAVFTAALLLLRYGFGAGSVKTEIQQSLSAGFQEVKTSINTLGARMDSYERAREAEAKERRISELEAVRRQGEIEQLRRDVADLERRADKLEGRANNLELRLAKALKDSGTIRAVKDED